MKSLPDKTRIGTSRGVGDRKGLMMRVSVFCLLGLSAGSALLGQARPGEGWNIEPRGNSIAIHAGSLNRVIELDGVNIGASSLQVQSHEILDKRYPELEFRIARAEPNREPRRIEERDDSEAILSTATFRSTDALTVNAPLAEFDDGVEWTNPVTLDSLAWHTHFDRIAPVISSPHDGVTRLVLRARAVSVPDLQDVAVSIVYEIHEGHPAIRQWMEIVNNSLVWYRLDKLTLTPLRVGLALPEIQALTPDDRASVSSVRSFASRDRTYGLILGSEVPSATRAMDTVTGTMGYADEYFEWILGPGERFVSEPVSYYGFAGDVLTTISGESTPLDRCVEGNYKRYLSDCLGAATDRADLRAPRYCTWSNYGEHITEETARRAIRIAARCGFDTFQIDDGWQRDRLGTEPHVEKFPDFDDMCDLARQSKITLGLWVSCYRTENSKDFKVVPQGLSLPPVKRLEGFGMSFASDWREYYAQDLVYLRDRYGAKYFKQDFTNIRLGDLAAGHESRTRKESYLRGLRGLLESQLLISEMSPDITTLISHEIYWGTPGVPCDLAAMKHAAYFHIPPNDYSGLGGHRKKLIAEYADLVDPDQAREGLMQGCWNARQRYFAHRGLPLHILEYYAAATANIRGSLTTDVQDRQICSFLMGAPVVYAGDLESLTEENILHYRKRFDLLKGLHEQYNIYRHFQYSGVPEPTETGWHWWGKLNEDHEGIVVVLRGTGGAEERAVNIPWVAADETYSLKLLFTDSELGEFSGRQLREEGVRVALPRLGQEMLQVVLK